MVALPDDYISRPFGGFVLDELIGSGATAEAFRCAHIPTGLFYVLRLGVEEDDLWNGPPMFPPSNGATERKTVEICWAVTGEAWAAGGESGFVHVFRIVDSRDVVPLSAPVRVRGALGMANARSLPPPEGVLGEMFSLYDEAVSMMYADAALGDTTLSEWCSKWRLVTGGARLMSKVMPLIDAGELSPSQNQHEWTRGMLAKLRAEEGREFELAENVLVKLIHAVASERLDWAGFEATLRCPFFRLNVQRAEVEQLLLLHRLFEEPEEQHYQSEGLDYARQWLAIVLGTLAEPAFDPGEDPSKFIRIETEPPRVQDDWVVLQEYAGATPTVFEATKVLVDLG